MDMPEFLEKLKTSKHKTRWYLSNEGKIRSEFGWCPMHFVSFLSEKPQPPDLCFRANIGLKRMILVKSYRLRIIGVIVIKNSGKICSIY
jgi:hypothetical protein